jgi:argonaute-like protein implicated in RNA metabolism and viral defense
VGTRTRKGEAAPPRGLRVDLAHNEALVCLKGPKELRQTTDGIPKPFLLRLHKDSTFRDLSYLARQVYDFSCMSWRTLLPSPLPITILYSDLVARNLLLLRDVTGWSPENILGQVGRSLWFL